MINRSQFCEAQARRGYEVENLGLVTILRHIDHHGMLYTALWFWNEDGSLNQHMEPTWSVTPA